uniref:Tubulin-specific chaperone A n=2 Tax=Timema TaxID=61471 RepID=A0A7R9IS65_9NEOP|nr:unnamed protein product [Timema bartmani]CAD7463628.1 unnamed protein product [Timema tahoe]
MSDPRLKTLRIKTGVVKRLAKEKLMYQKEAEQQKERVQKFKDEGKCEHDIRKQEEVLQESLMMVPDCQRRLMKAYEELKDLIENEEELKSSQEYVAAQKILEESKAELPEHNNTTLIC